MSGETHSFHCLWLMLVASIGAHRRCGVGVCGPQPQGVVVAAGHDDGWVGLAAYRFAKQGLPCGIDALRVEKWPTTPLSVTCTLSAWMPSG